MKERNFAQKASRMVASTTSFSALVGSQIAAESSNATLESVAILAVVV